MNAIEMQRAGMGGLGSDPFDPFNPDSIVYDPSLYPHTTPPYSQAPNSQSSSNRSNQLTLLGLGLEKVFSNIFAPVGTSVAQAGGGFNANQGLSQAQIQQLLYQQRTGAGAAVTPGSVNILGLNIPYVYLIIGGLIFFFPGFTRRK